MQGWGRNRKRGKERRGGKGMGFVRRRGRRLGEGLVGAEYGGRERGSIGEGVGGERGRGGGEDLVFLLQCLPELSFG